MIEAKLKKLFYNNPAVLIHLDEIRNAVLNNQLLPTTAADKLIQFFKESISVDF